MPQAPFEKGQSRGRRRASELMATYGLVIVFILVALQRMPDRTISSRPKF
jgi:hypothetical protein